jgi:hypothetical protein
MPDFSSFSPSDLKALAEAVAALQEQKRTKVWASLWGFLKPVLLLLLLACVFAGGVASRGCLPSSPTPSPAPGPASTFQELGRAYGPALASAYADAWAGFATQIAAGLTVDQALTALETDWKARRQGLFEARLTPALEKIVPGGKDPTTEQRAALATAARDLAAGLKETGYDHRSP